MGKESMEQYKNKIEGIHVFLAVIVILLIFPIILLILVVGIVHHFIRGGCEAVSDMFWILKRPKY